MIRKIGEPIEVRVVSESFHIETPYDRWATVETVVAYENEVRDNEDEIVRNLYENALLGLSVSGSPHRIAEDVYRLLNQLPPNLIEVWVTAGMSRGGFVVREG